jgi:hypothetical protein
LDYDLQSDHDYNELLPCSLDHYFQDTELARYNNKIHSSTNNETMRLQHDLEEHSPAKVRIPTEEQMRESRKNMIGNIDYIMQYGNVSGNPETAEIWERLEMTIQDFQVEARKIILGSSTPTKEKSVVWPAFTMKKKQTTKRFKGITG